MNTKIFASLAGAIVTLIIALTGSYLSLDRRVEARTTPDEVRQIIDDKTSARLDEVLRRQEHMDKQLDRLGEAIFRLAPPPRAQ